MSWPQAKPPLHDGPGVQRLASGEACGAGLEASLELVGVLTITALSLASLSLPFYFYFLGVLSNNSNSLEGGTLLRASRVAFFVRRLKWAVRS